MSSSAKPDRLFLPAFGALCSRLAVAAGLRPLAFASKAQRAWSAEAGRVFDSLAQGGARMSRVIFVAYDERPAFAWLDRVLDGKLGSPELVVFAPAILGRAGFRFESVTRANAPPKFTRVTEAVFGVRQGAPDQVFWGQTVEAFGSEPHARAFVLGHEAGHALFSKERWKLIKTGLLAGRTELGQRAATLVESFAVDRGAKEHPGERALALAIEEAMCDALGCWAAARAGCSNAPQKAAALRSATAASSHPVYRTNWMTENLPSDLERLRFGQLRQAMTRLCELHGPALALRFAPPSVEGSLAGRRETLRLETPSFQAGPSAPA